MIRQSFLMLSLLGITKLLLMMNIEMNEMDRLCMGFFVKKN